MCVRDGNVSSYTHIHTHTPTHTHTQVVALVAAIAGIVAIFVNHSEHATPALWSLHSWVGGLTLVLYVLQLAYGRWTCNTWMWL
jgi:uncharacterized membrane protein (UPF0182 family)